MRHIKWVALRQRITGDGCRRRFFSAVATIVSSFAVFVPLLGHSATTNSTVETIDAYTREVIDLPPSAVFNKLVEAARSVKEDSVNRVKSQQTVDNINRAVGYSAALDQMYEEGSREAAFYSAAYRKLSCLGLKQASSSENQALVDDCFSDCMEMLRFAADGNDARAMRELAEYHENGYGIRASKLGAVEWLLKAGRVSLERSNRERAYEDAEKALALIPDHPGALKLRRRILDVSAGSGTPPSDLHPLK